MLCFPKVEDVRLARAPLKEVICQVRFPVILRIGTEQPVEFQERIRERFPDFSWERGMTLKIDPVGDQPPATPAPPEARGDRESGSCH
jgi:uncharacterized protein (TIGR04255 family)